VCCFRPNPFRNLGLTDTDVVAMRDLGIGVKVFKKLVKFFYKMDKDRSGEIDVQEFLDFFDVESQFARRAFSIMDEDRSGQIDVREFVIGIWNYLTFDKNTLIAFAFDMYDVDGSGVLEWEELEAVVWDIYGGWDGDPAVARQNRNAKRCLDHVRQEMRRMERARDEQEHKNATAQREEDYTPVLARDFMVSADLFHDFVSKHEAMLQPARAVQLMMQRRILGPAFWKEATRYRQWITARRFGEVGAMQKWKETKFLLDDLKTAHARGLDPRALEASLDVVAAQEELRRKRAEAKRAEAGAGEPVGALAEAGAEDAAGAPSSDSTPARSWMSVQAEYARTRRSCVGRCVARLGTALLLVTNALLLAAAVPVVASAVALRQTAYAALVPASAADALLAVGAAVAAVAVLGIAGVCAQRSRDRRLAEFDKTAFAAFHDEVDSFEAATLCAFILALAAVMTVQGLVALRAVSETHDVDGLRRYDPLTGAAAANALERQADVLVLDEDHEAAWLGTQTLLECCGWASSADASATGTFCCLPTGRLDCAQAGAAPEEPCRGAAADAVERGLDAALLGALGLAGVEALNLLAALHLRFSGA
jgi:serine/threonine-protein phosphatase 2B regulatory subunit